MFKTDFVDVLILGYYKNEPYIKEFLEHLFYEKKITNEKILNTPFFTEETSTDSLIDVLLPLSSLPKHNFNNNKNTFIDKKNKYFQINITLPQQKNTKKEIDVLSKTFQLLLENKENFIIVFKHNFFATLPKIELLFKDKKKDLDLQNTEDLNLVEKILPKLHKNFNFNFI